MLVRRCAWHPLYRGYPFIIGVASWRGFRIRYTDGICKDCANRVRVDWGLRPSLNGVPSGFADWLRLPRAALVAAAVVAAILAARTIDENGIGGSGSRQMASAPVGVASTAPPASQPSAVQRPRAAREPVAERPAAEVAPSSRGIALGSRGTPAGRSPRRAMAPRPVLRSSSPSTPVVLAAEEPAALAASSPVAPPPVQVASAPAAPAGEAVSRPIGAGPTDFASHPRSLVAFLDERGRGTAPFGVQAP